MPGKIRERLLIVAVVICLGVLAADRLIVTPLVSIWKKHAERIADLRQSVDKGTQLLDREKSLTSRWSEMKKRSMPAQMPMTETEVFGSVNKWAEACNLSVTSLKPRWILDEEDCRKLEVRLSATGDLNAIAHFLYTFESDKQAHRIEDIDLTARDDQGRQLALDLRFTGLVIEEKKQ